MGIGLRFASSTVYKKVIALVSGDRFSLDDASRRNSKRTGVVFLSSSRLKSIGRGDEFGFQPRGEKRCADPRSSDILRMIHCFSYVYGPSRR